jgi:hypothetical protein
MTQVLRPLTLAELLDRTFSLYRQHILVFIGLIALPNLLMVGARILNGAFVAGANPEDLGPALIGLGATFVLALLSMFTMTISQAATMVAVSRLHLNQSVSIGGAFGSLRGRLFRICGISLAIIFLSALGLLACIVPGIYLMLRWSLAVPAAVLENVGLGQAMARSTTLIEGWYGRVFMIYLLYFLLITSFQAALMLPAIVVAGMRDETLLNAPFWLQASLEIVQFFAQCLVGPLATISVALVYYDSRVRKEGFDLEHLLTQVEATAPAPAPTA